MTHGWPALLIRLSNKDFGCTISNVVVKGIWRNKKKNLIFIQFIAGYSKPKIWFCAS